MDEALRVLDAAGFEATYVHADIGWDFWCREGNPLPGRTIKLLEEHRVDCSGPLPQNQRRGRGELAPELRVKFVMPVPLLACQHFDWISVSPLSHYTGNPDFIRRGARGEIEDPWWMW
jgi:3-isopropylmalate dehydrogenase